MNAGVTEHEIDNERVLLSRAQAGDMDAFGEICRTYEGRLLRHAVSLGWAVSAAEDLVQETLVGAWKSVRRYDGTCRYSTWLCAILLNHHRKLLRRSRLLRLFESQREADEAKSGWERIASGDAAPDAAAQRRDDALAMRHCLAALPPKQQQVVYLRFYADDSLEGIAASVGCSIGTVKSRLFHALEKLRRMKALQSPDELAVPCPAYGTAGTQCLVL